MVHVLQVEHGIVLIKPPYPRVLPSELKIVVVTTKANVGSLAIGKFERLVAGDRHRQCGANAGASLASIGLPNAAQGGRAAEPEVSVNRRPEPLFAKIAAQVAFEAADGSFRLQHGDRGSGERGIAGE